VSGKYPGYRTMTGAQRHNARQDAIWERAKELKTELTPAGEQYVVPGCERDPARAKSKQLDLWS